MLAQGWSGRELLCQGLTFSLRALLGPDVSEEEACCLPASLGEAVLGDRYPQPPANPAPRTHSSCWEVRVPGLKGRCGRPAPLEPLVLPGHAPGGATASLATGPALHLHSPICPSSASCPHVCLTRAPAPASPSAGPTWLCSVVPCLGPELLGRCWACGTRQEQGCMLLTLCPRQCFGWSESSLLVETGCPAARGGWVSGRRDTRYFWYQWF